MPTATETPTRAFVPANAGKGKDSPKELAPEPPDNSIAETLDSGKPDHEQIAQVAYGFWLERADQGAGSADDDWLRAERELGGR